MDDLTQGPHIFLSSIIGFLLVLNLGISSFSGLRFKNLPLAPRSLPLLYQKKSRLCRRTEDHRETRQSVLSELTNVSAVHLRFYADTLATTVGVSYRQSDQLSEQKGPCDGRADERADSESPAFILQGRRRGRRSLAAN